MENPFDAFCKGIQTDEFVHKRMCQQNTNFTSVMKTLTSKSGKTYTIPVIRMPAGTILYSGNTWDTGFKPEPDASKDDPYTQSGMWFSWVSVTASGYNRDMKPKSYRALRDLDLLDLWTPAAWESLFSEFGDDVYLTEFAGISRESAKPFVKLSKETGFFANSQCKDDECTTMEWRGLIWGPNLGNYKRMSRYEYDTGAIDKVYKAFPTGIDGVFALPTPSDSSDYPWLRNPTVRRVFHEEINIRPGYSDRLAIVKGGQRKKSTRRSLRKKK